MIHLEFRNALRRLRQRPGYTALSLLVLSLGLGAMLFTLDAVHSMVLKPLPFPQAERLVTVGHARASSQWLGDLDSADFLRLRAELRSIDGMGAYANLTANLSPGGGALPTRYDGVAFDRAMFELLGVQPVLGRAFSAEDDRPGAPTVALLSHRVWRKDFAADPGVLGRQVQLNGQPATLIGVMPEGFHFPVIGDVTTGRSKWWLGWPRVSESSNFAPNSTPSPPDSAPSCAAPAISANCAPRRWPTASSMPRRAACCG